MPRRLHIRTGRTDIMNRKLDMGVAWTQTTAMIGANRDTISAIAGLFFFLPSFAASLLMPELVNPQPVGPQDGDPQAAMRAMIDQMSALYAENWPLILATIAAQFIGSLCLFALLSDRGNPTVREALGTGLRSLPTYLAAQLISAVGVGVALGLPLGLVSSLAAPAVAALVSLVLIVVVFYLFIKFALIAPVIAVENERNPISALTRSWRLTKGNSLRILLFLLLLFVTIGIISALVTAVLTLVLSAFGGAVASIGTGLVSAAVNTLISVIFLVVIAAIHRQLAGTMPEGLAATFE